MSVNKVPYKETNNYNQGKSGGGVKKNPGPAKGRGSGNPTSGGAITTPTKSKMR
jgi:hypothetical protein